MKRFLLIGLDGAEPLLVQRWMLENRLPHLARLKKEGLFCPLAGTMPPATFPAWTTCVTGVNPGRHGILDFTQMDAGNYSVHFVNSTMRKAPALWNILSAAGKRCAVLGVPGTYPPEEINGVMVSGFDSPVCTRIDKSFVYPAGIYDDVREWRFADFQESRIGPKWHDTVFPKMMESISIKESIAVKLLQREPWDFFMAVFGESDTVAHHFWMFHDPVSPRFKPGGRNDAIRLIYQRLDAAVGALIRAAGEDVTVCIVSDHGFGGAGTGVIHLNNWLAERDYLKFAPAKPNLLKSAAMSLVPQHLRGAMFRRLQDMAARAESQSRFAGIDWNHTFAWSEELNYFPSIRINLKGREPAGQIAPESYRDFCAKLCEELESWPPIKKAWRREMLYQGPYVDRAPDIILELDLEQGYSYSCLRSRGGPSFRRLGPDEYNGGKERGMNGSHRPTGIFFASKQIPCGAALIEDVAPTVLAELQVPAPDMDGSPIFGSGATTAPAAPAPPHYEEAPYTREEEKVIEERLRSLGYLE